jgi:hypothetical protein
MSERDEADEASSRTSRRTMLASLAALALGPVVGCSAPIAAVSVREPRRPPSAPPRVTPPASRSAEPNVVPPPEAPSPPPPEPPPPPRVMLPLPERPAGAETGTAFIERVRAMPRRRYEAAVFAAIMSGNVPRFERELVPVSLEGVDADGERHTGVIFVLCDYLAVGSDDDFLLAPMTPRTAQRIADRTETLLPTRKLVDTIYGAAACRLKPRWIEGGPNPDLDDHTDFETHKAMLDEQRKVEHVRLGELVAGDKKDIVITNELERRPKKVAIYGWHRGVGKPIQPLTTVHAGFYADYSHGVRLVHATMTVDGEDRPTAKVLTDPRLCCLVSDEGPMCVTGYPI